MLCSISAYTMHIIYDTYLYSYQAHIFVSLVKWSTKRSARYNKKQIKTILNFLKVLAENDIGKTASPWVSERTGEAPPLSTPSPVVYPVSHSQLELQWSPPTDDQARGIITTYRVYFYAKNDLNTNPYAPPYLWKVWILRKIIVAPFNFNNFHDLFFTVFMIIIISQK